MSEQADEKPECSPYAEVYAHLEQVKDILEEWKEAEVCLMVLEAARANVNN